MAIARWGDISRSFAEMHGTVHSFILATYQSAQAREGSLYDEHRADVNRLFASLFSAEEAGKFEQEVQGYAFGQASLLRLQQEAKDKGILLESCHFSHSKHRDYRQRPRIPELKVCLQQTAVRLGSAQQ